MTELSITRAWSEAMAFVQSAFGPLFLIAVLLIVLPGAALEYVLPAEDGPVPTDLGQWWATFGPFFVFLPILIMLGMIGTIAINHLAIQDGASVGEALGVGARRFLILLIAGIVISLAVALTFLPAFALLWPQEGESASVGTALLVGVVYFALFVALSVKLLLITAVAAAERGGPLALIARSWALTRGYFWKLLGFLVLFWIAAGVLIGVTFLLVGLVTGLLFGLPEPGSTAYFVLSLASAAMQAAVSTVFAVAVARIYAQLTGSGDRSVFA
jgi:hypothetical protein